MQINNIIRCLEIVRDTNPNDWYPIDAEHDIIYLRLYEVTKDSEAGKELIKLGCFQEDDGGWYLYT